MNVKEFFAASNSYTGFVSYFDKIFTPKDYEKIFILKGGPGTGKSHFMKTICEAFHTDGISSESILCSSDPHSLDGVILKKDGKKIAVIDGTSPHSTDPICPGAIEKIINLGDSWNETLIRSNRSQIELLNDEKGRHYKSAYQYLSIAGKCIDFIDEDMKSVLDVSYRDILNDILPEIKKENGRVSLRLTSAFGKNGFYELTGLGALSETEINIVGIYGVEYFFINSVLDNALCIGANITLSPSPLDKRKTDAILFDTERISVSVGNKNYSGKAKTIDASRYINTQKLRQINNKLETLYKEREAMLWCATDEFKKASDAHMELEKIYTAAMSFGKNKKLFEKVRDEINEILFSGTSV
jgi:hypothetical protein